MRRRRRGEHWELDDAAAVLPRSNDTERVAPSEKLRSLEPGEYVKLRFRLLHPRRGAPPAERMWVRVTARYGDGYVGILENQPETIPELDKGDAIRFGPEHVLSIWEPASHESKVAFVNRRLLENGPAKPPGVLCHDPADEDLPPLPDGRRRSGWQLLVGDETKEELDDPEAFVLVPLSDLVHRYAAFAALVASEERGRQYTWDEASWRYVDRGAYEPED